MSRTVDLHRAERRAIDVGINLAAAAFVWWRFRRPTRRDVLIAVVGRLDDVRYARAQRRGARLALRMHEDGTLAARSPRKIVQRPVEVEAVEPS